MVGALVVSDGERSPFLVHKDAAWWWTGLAIKYAQQMGMHREPRNVRDVGGERMQSLRRRIWWTLFVGRERSSLHWGGADRNKHRPGSD